MNGRYADGWGEPARPDWAIEPTGEWQPSFPGQRYPGDPGPKPPSHRRASGRASVPTGREAMAPAGTRTGRPAEFERRKPPEEAPGSANSRGAGNGRTGRDDGRAGPDDGWTGHDGGWSGPDPEQWATGRRGNGRVRDGRLFVVDDDWSQPPPPEPDGWRDRDPGRRPGPMPDRRRRDPDPMDDEPTPDRRTGARGDGRVFPGDLPGVVRRISGQAPVRRDPSRMGRDPERMARDPERMGRDPERMGRDPERMGRDPERMGREAGRGFDPAASAAPPDPADRRPRWPAASPPGQAGDTTDRRPPAWADGAARSGGTSSETGPELRGPQGPGRPGPRPGPTADGPGRTVGGSGSPRWLDSTGPRPVGDEGAFTAGSEPPDVDPPGVRRSDRDRLPGAGPRPGAVGGRARPAGPPPSREAPEVRHDPGREGGRFLDPDALIRRPTPGTPLDGTGRPVRPAYRPYEPDRYGIDHPERHPTDQPRPMDRRPTGRHAGGGRVANPGSEFDNGPRRDSEFRPDSDHRRDVEHGRDVEHRRESDHRREGEPARDSEQRYDAGRSPAAGRDPGREPESDAGSAWLHPAKPTEPAPAHSRHAKPDETEVPPARTDLPPARPVSAPPAARLRLEYLPGISDNGPEPAAAGQDAPAAFPLGMGTGDRNDGPPRSAPGAEPPVLPMGQADGVGTAPVPGAGPAGRGEWSDPLRSEPPAPIRAEPPAPIRAEPPAPLRAEPADPRTRESRPETVEPLSRRPEPESDNHQERDGRDSGREESDRPGFGSPESSGPGSSGPESDRPEGQPAERADPEPDGADPVGAEAGHLDLLGTTDPSADDTSGSEPAGRSPDPFPADTELLIEPAAPEMVTVHIEPASGTRIGPPPGRPALDLDLDLDGRPALIAANPTDASATTPPTVSGGAVPVEPPRAAQPESSGSPDFDPSVSVPVDPPVPVDSAGSADPDPDPDRDGPAPADPAGETGPDPAASPEPGPPAVSPPGPPVAEASPDIVVPAPEGPVAGAATALRAPTMLTPVVRPDEPTDTDASVETATEAESTPEPPADPEQLLASYQWRFHHDTLRELVEDPDELRTVRDRLTEKVRPATDNATRARLLSLRAVVSRILGDLGKALSDGRLALAHAEATGELRRIAIAQARLAHVLQWRGDFAEADRLFEEANSSELPDRLRATMHEHAGRSCYDQGRYMEACNHFERALELRKVEDPDLIARTELALDAVFNKVAQNGWGPYPRSRDEILQLHRPPTPTFSEKVQRWGYADPDGRLAVPPSYADAQPFRDGVAWVRRPETRTWELIDETGETLVDSSAGYLGVGSFSDGLAWVSRDGTGGWVAIDKTNRLVIPVGFDDVRPFRRGFAAVRRGPGWGAVDKNGRLVVPPRYTAFTTALTDGRYLDGFTDEGLAIVDAGGRKGVVDRNGLMIVPPSYPALVIHPVAFLIGNGSGQWGALDRHGEPLIDVVHPSRTDVMDEIDRLLADTKPVL